MAAEDKGNDNCAGIDISAGAELVFASFCAGE